MIVVRMNGNSDAVAAPLDKPLTPTKEVPGIRSMASLRFEASLVKDVVPYIEKTTTLLQMQITGH